MRRVLAGLVGGVFSALLANSGCVYRTGEGQSQQSDARTAFHKDADELDELERYCLRSAQLFCDGLAPCCASINYGFERDICLLVRAEHCVSPRMAGGEFVAQAAPACLDRTSKQFEECLQPFGEARKPSSIHSLSRCDEAWSGLVNTPEYYAEGESCEGSLKRCPEGTFCDDQTSGDDRVCLPVRSEGGDCRYTAHCEPGLYCGARVCTRQVDLHADCEYGEECTSALCCGRECVRAPAVDAHLCWLFNYPGGDYPDELRDTDNVCVSIATNTSAMQ